MVIGQYSVRVPSDHPVITHDCMLFTAKSVPCTEMQIPQKALSMWVWAEDLQRCEGEDSAAVIWHTVNNPRNLHSDCAPLGPASPRCAATGCRPNAGLSAAQGAGEGGGGSQVRGFIVVGCHLPSTYSSAYMCTHIEKKLSSPPRQCFQDFTLILFVWAFNLDCMLTEQVGALMVKCRPRLKQRSVNYPR